MKTCEDCGSPVYNLGCTWCNEEAYIEEQEYFNWLEEMRAEIENAEYPGGVEMDNYKEEHKKIRG